MGDVKRYGFRKDPMADCYCDMEETDRGGYVTEEEYESLRSRLAEADALLREMLAWKVAIECIAPELGGAIMTLVRIDAHLARKP